MSNFLSNDPSSCKALGSKLKDIQVSAAESESPNNCIDFDSSDWVEEGKHYVLEITPTTHDKGPKPLISVQESVSGDCYMAVGVEEFWKSDGTLKMKVICDPDCRFDGRVIIDG